MGGPSNADWLGTPGAATYVGLNQRTIYKIVDQGLLTGYKLGRILRFRRQDLDTYLEASKPRSLEASKVQPGELRHLRPDTYKGKS